MKKLTDGKLTRFPFRNPLQLQAWLEDLSLEGWELEEVRGEYGRFRRIEPRRIRYRMEPDPSTLNTTDGDIAERDQLYADMRATWDAPNDIVAIDGVERWWERSPDPMDARYSMAVGPDGIPWYGNTPKNVYGVVMCFCI